MKADAPEGGVQRMSVMAIYKLEKILDNPKYEGFALGEVPSLRGKGNRYADLDQDFDSRTCEWVVPRLSGIWKPPRVVGRVRPYNDFPCLALSYPVFSQRAVELLGNVLEPNGELLPLVTSVGSYFLFNCTTVADVIDFERSKLDYLNTNSILEIDHLEVFEDRLAALSIFQLRKYPGRCCVTDAVARRIREARLEGFEFRKLWPLPKDVPYWLHRKRPECHDELTAQPRPEPRAIKGNAVVLTLALQRDEPSQEEKSRFEQIADHLDAILVNPRRDAKYIGNVEIAEFVPGEARYFFSCPDADELAKKLKPWVIALDWLGQKRLVKRYGEFMDVEATEETVAI
jgi:Immunity protein family (Imm11)